MRSCEGQETRINRKEVKKIKTDIGKSRITKNDKRTDDKIPSKSLTLTLNSKHPNVLHPKPDKRPRQHQHPQRSPLIPLPQVKQHPIMINHTMLIDNLTESQLNLLLFSTRRSLIGASSFLRDETLDPRQHRSLPLIERNDLVELVTAQIFICTIRLRRGRGSVP